MALRTTTGFQPLTVQMFTRMPIQTGRYVDMKKKDVLLRAATYLFARKGYKDTAMGELSKMTDVAEGTILDRKSVV